ncbi:MAG TPA: DNRLRE domain-containing protein [Thermoanaerobaculia bacterium]|nr:DNRLRE domain-containing protein [Thermoanaerobaculia bacterium]
MRKKLAVLLGTGMGLCLAATLSAQTVNLPAGADSYIRSGNADHNWGQEDHLRVRGSERYRSLVRFDPAALAAAVGQGSLVSATLELSVDDVSGNWGGSGQTVDLHRLTAAWTEGGVTWNCAVDSSPGNNRTDCSSNWAGGAFEPAATDTLFVTRDLNGRVSLDVTADVASFLSGTPNFGWLLKKTDESGSSQIDFKSRERSPNSAPRLVLVVESATSDAVPPRLAITQPERSFVVNDPTPAIELSYSDGGSGVNLASLNVTVDGRAASCQAGPSSALCEPAPLGSGQHTISVSLADVAGNRATATARFQLVIGPALHTLTFPALGDTYIDQGKADRNFGGENELKLGKSPRRRSLAQFDGATLGSLAAGGTLVSAKLLVTVKENHGNWGRSGREVGAHRLNTAWTERGATWNCAVDSNPGNDRTDCNPGWNGGDFEAAASSTVTVTGRTRGTLELDVTADVAAVLAGGPHRGWLIKKEDEGSSGEMEFFSRERSRQHPPTLVVVINVPALDTTPPTIVASVAPAPNGAGWNRSAVTVSFTCTDSGSGVALCPDPVTLTTDGAAQVVSGTATDVAGNSASTSVTVNLDATAPAVLASADPAPNGAGWNRTAVTISFQCTDALSGVASCPQAQTVANEGAGQVVSGTATDVADNSASASVTVSLDSTPPALAITSPADGTTVSDPQVTLTGTVSDGLSGLASVTCNGGAASLAGGGFSCTVSLGPGPNGLQVVATDVAGNVSSASITVNQATGGDTTPPRISITAPASGSFVLEARPEVRVTLSDDTAIDFASLALTANGNPLAASCQTDGPDAARCTLGQDLADGTVALGATVADLAGNPASAAASFVVDTAGLGVAITSPTDGSVTTGDSVAVSGTASAGVASVVINGVPAPIAAGSFTATVPLREGINMVVALATKASGRTGTASIQVTRDIFAPIVRIDSPRQGFVSVNNTVAVTGLVNDIVPGGAEATVTVNGVAAGVGGGAFLLESLPLVRGPNTLEAVATDRAGNVGRHSIQVFYQPPVGARITLGSGNGQFGVVDNDVPQPLVATVVDDLGNPVAGRLVRFEVTRNNGLLRHGAGDSPVRELQAPTNGAGQASVIWTLGDTAGVGTNRVIASVVGAAGEVEFCATGLPRPAERILMTMGDNQRGVVGAPLTTPLEALVIDHGGNPIEGVTVTFTVEKGGGTLEGGPSVARTTGPDGLARAVLTLGREP